MERVTHLTSPNISYFPIPSLYASLQEEDIALLEKTYSLVVRGVFSEAENAYERLPFRLESNAVTVIGRSQGLILQWRFREAHQVLQAAVDQDDGSNHEEVLLIRAFFAYVSIVFKGSFVQARESIMELGMFLMKIPPDGFTDLQVYCLREYLRLIEEASKGSPNFDKEPFLGLFASCDSGLGALKKIRMHLQSSGRWREVLVLHDMEEDMYADVVQKADVLRSILSSMGTSPFPLPVKYLKAAKHNTLAHFYDEMNQSEQAEKEIREAEEQCRDYHGNPHPYLSKIIRVCRLKIDAASMDLIDIDVAMDLADCAAAEGFYRAEWLFLQLVIGALVARRSNLLISERRNMEWRARNENILIKLGNIYELCRIAILNRDFYGAEYQESLEWWKGFDVLHPHYNIWQHQIGRQLTLSSMHVNLDDYVPALEARQRAEVLLEECGQFWEPCLREFQSRASHSTPKITTRSQFRQRQLRGKSDMLLKYTFEDYQNRHMTVPDPVSGRFYYGTLGVKAVGLRKAPFEALLEWLSADIQSAELGPAQLEDILGLPLATLTTAECLEYLENLSSNGLITILYGSLEDPVACERWQHTFDALRSWLDHTESFFEIQQQYMLIELQRTRIERSQSKTLQHIPECRRGIDLLHSIRYADELKDNVPLFGISCHIWLALALASSWLRAQDWTEKMEKDLTEAVELLRQALADFGSYDASVHPGIANGNAYIYGMGYFALGHLYVTKFEAGGGINMNQALAFLGSAESYFREKWKAFSSKNGFAAIKSHLRTLEQPMINQIFPEAIRIQCTAHGASLHADSIWEWVQTAKCRGLGSLGRFAAIDNYYTETFLKSGDDDGKGFGTEDLRRLSLVARTSVVFIDWYTNFHNGEIGVPIMLAWRVGGAVRLFKFGDDLDALDLTDYKRQFLSAMEREENYEQDEDETRTPTYWLQKFEGLVRPVLEISEPGDVLVFSPCGLLHGIPLHAIVFDGQPLICRNPITYTTSMKSLFYAALARETDKGTDEPSHFLPAVFGNTPSEQGQESVERLAELLNVRPNTGSDFTRGRFLTELDRDIDLLHYHAHAYADDGEPLKQALQFQDELIAVEDILDIAPKLRSYHATILGCSSGVTVRTTSNEPLGLVPALMYNGASSVVSALWPIDDHDAALFANEFYSAFASDHQDEAATSNAQSQTRIIDMALATQRAVLGILHSEDGRQGLKHWAGFVFNGWWMLRVPEKRQKKPTDLDKFPVMYSARPWPPPPPAPPVRVRSWLLMVPRWFSFYTLWPYFRW